MQRRLNRIGLGLAATAYLNRVHTYDQASHCIVALHRQSLQPYAPSTRLHGCSGVLAFVRSSVGSCDNPWHFLG
jgi:hypothetical protein